MAVVALKAAEAPPTQVQRMEALVESAEGRQRAASDSYESAEARYRAAAVEHQLDAKGSPASLAALRQARDEARDNLANCRAALTEARRRLAEAQAEDEATAKREAHERLTAQVTKACNDVETMTRTWFETLRQGDEQACAVMNGFYALFDLSPRLNSLTPESRRAQMEMLHNRLTELHEGYTGATRSGGGSWRPPEFTGAKAHLLDLIGYARKV